MFTRCIFCHAQLAENQSLEHFRHGRKVAFDPSRGRLWAICAACGRWNLAPIEERWEALEELEKLSTDRARLLSKTDNIALLRAEDVELVRVGEARLTEEAWWRYGRDLLRRRKASHVIQAAEGVAMVAAAVATGGMAAGFVGGSVFLPLARWWRFGSTAWRGESRCIRCGNPLEKLRFSDSGRLVLLHSGDASEAGDVSVRLVCAFCGDAYGDAAGHVFTDTAAESLLRRSLAYHHFRGASESRLREATRAIEAAGSVEGLTRGVARRRIPLRTLEKDHRTHAIALEIAVNEETERKLLELELAELERRWKEEEEIAAIADRELVFLPFRSRGQTAGGAETDA